MVVEDAKITLKFTEFKSKVLDKNAILADATTALSELATELSLTVSIVSDAKVGDSGEEDKTDESSSDTANSEDETSSTTSTQNNIPTSSPNANHTHSFGTATCTEPAKCSCGATKGNPAGHKWTDATCKKAKTCSACGATEGGLGEHSFKNGTCSVCGAADSINPKDNLTYDKDYVGKVYFDDGPGIKMAPGVNFTKDGDSYICVVLSVTYNKEPEEILPEMTYITIGGVKYYREGAGQMPHNLEITDTEIIVLGGMFSTDPGATSFKLKVQSDGTLKVTQSNMRNFPVGTILY